MGSFYILIAIFIWSSLGIIVRMANTHLTYLIFFPACIAFITQSLILVSTNERKKIPRAGRILYLLLLGPVFLMNSLLFYYAFTHTTIANAVLTHYTAPVFVSILSPILLRESVERIALPSILISTSGLLLMLKGFSISDGSVAGISAGILSGLTYAFLIIIGRFLAKNFSLLMITATQNLIVLLLLLPFISEIPWESAGYFVLLGLVHSTVAPLMYVRGLREVKASKASILGYLEPVGAMLFAAAIFKEIPGIRAVLGGILIIFSGYLIINKSENPKKGDRS